MKNCIAYIHHGWVITSIDERPQFRNNIYTNKADFKLTNNSKNSKAKTIQSLSIYHQKNMIEIFLPKELNRRLKLQHLKRSLYYKWTHCVTKTGHIVASLQLLIYDNKTNRSINKMNFSFKFRIN